MTGQLRDLLPILCALYLPAGLLLVLVVALHFRADIPIDFFLRDLAALAGMNPFYGLVSNLGILFWAAAATICLFVAAQLRRRGTAGDLPGFLLTAGLFTALLLLDDLFMLHEWAFPKLSGLPEQALFAAYAAIFLAWAIRYRKTILERRVVVLLAAMGCFAASIVFDLGVLPLSGNWELLLEDAAKFMGILTWFAYFLGMAADALRAAAIED